MVQRTVRHAKTQNAEKTTLTLGEVQDENGSAHEVLGELIFQQTDESTQEMRRRNHFTVSVEEKSLICFLGATLITKRDLPIINPATTLEVLAMRSMRGRDCTISILGCVCNDSSGDQNNVLLFFSLPELKLLQEVHHVGAFSVMPLFHPLEKQIVVIPSSECVRLGIDTWRDGYVFQSTGVTANILRNSNEKKGEKMEQTKEVGVEEEKEVDAKDNRDYIELTDSIVVKDMKAAYKSFLPSPYCQPTSCCSSSSSPSASASLPSSTSLSSSASSSSSATHLPSDSVKDPSLRWLIIEPPTLSRAYVLSPSHHATQIHPLPNSTLSKGSEDSHSTQIDIENVHHKSAVEYSENNENEESCQIISHPGHFFSCIGNFENYAIEDNPSNLMLNTSKNGAKLGSWKDGKQVMDADKEIKDKSKKKRKKRSSNVNNSADTDIGEISVKKRCLETISENDLTDSNARKSDSLQSGIIPTRRVDINVKEVNSSTLHNTACEETKAKEDTTKNGSMNEKSKNAALLSSLPPDRQTPILEALRRRLKMAEESAECVGKRLESRTGVLAGVRSRLRDLTLPTTSYSTAVQRGSAVRGDLSVNSEAQGRKGTEQEGYQEEGEVEVVVRSGVGGSTSVLRSSMDLNYLVSKMKPLFGAEKTGRGRGREGDWNSNSRSSCNSGQSTSKNMTLGSKSSSSSSGSSRTAHSTQKNTQQKSSGTKSTYDVCVSDATYVRTDAEGSVTLLISLTFQNISMLPVFELSGGVHQISSSSSYSSSTTSSPSISLSSSIHCVGLSSTSSIVHSLYPLQTGRVGISVTLAPTALSSLNGCDDEISLIVSLYYKSLEGSNSLPIRLNIANNGERERLHLADKCAKICRLFKSNSFRSVLEVEHGWINTRFRGIEAAILRFKWTDKRTSKRQNITKQTPIVRQCDASFLMVKEKEILNNPYFGMKNSVDGNRFSFLPISGMDLLLSQKLIGNDIDSEDSSSSGGMSTSSSSSFHLRNILHGINSRFKTREFLSIRYNSSHENPVNDNGKNTVVLTTQNDGYDSMSHHTNNRNDCHKINTEISNPSTKYKNTINPYNPNTSNDSITDENDAHRNSLERTASHLVILSQPACKTNVTESNIELLNLQSLCQLFRVVRGGDECRTHTEAALSFALSTLSHATEDFDGILVPRSCTRNVLLSLCQLSVLLLDELQCISVAWRQQIVRKNYEHQIKDQKNEDNKYGKNQLNSSNKSDAENGVGTDVEYIQINPNLCVSVDLGYTILEKMNHTDILMSSLMSKCEPYL